MASQISGDGSAVSSSLARTITNATNASPIVVTTSVTHLFASGDEVIVAGVLGNLAANGRRKITVLSPTTFSLTGSAGSGAYVSGGTATDVSLTPAFQIPSDGDGPGINAASVNVAFETLADRTQHLAARVSRAQRDNVSGANAATTFTVLAATTLITASGLTANRVYTLSNTDAVSGDVVEILVSPNETYSITVSDDGGGVLAVLGAADATGAELADSNWASFVFRAGDWQLHSGIRRGFVQRVFTASGAWTSPPRATLTHVRALGGGGGGGGGGRSGLTEGGAAGGGAGGGAQHVDAWIQFAASTGYTIAVGAGGTAGAGGVAPATDATNGGDGGPSGISLTAAPFTAYLRADGAAGGQRGLPGANTRQAIQGGAPVMGVVKRGLTDVEGVGFQPCPGTGGCGSSYVAGARRNSTFDIETGTPTAAAFGGVAGTAGAQTGASGGGGPGGGGGASTWPGGHGGAGGLGGIGKDLVLPAAPTDGNPGVVGASYGAGGGGGGGGGASGGTAEKNGGAGAAGVAGVVVFTWVR